MSKSALQKQLILEAHVIQDFVPLFVDIDGTIVDPKIRTIV